MTVFYTEEDERTRRVVDFFLSQPVPRRMTLRPWPLPREQLMRREIGRNLAALSTRSDWIWFTDCDYCFGVGSLDALQGAVVSVTENLVYPQQILISRSHDLGDRAISILDGGPALVDIQMADFVPHVYRRAIGGVQIVRGTTSRELGYLNGSSLLRRTGHEWQGFTGDVRFRKSLGTSGIPICLPHVYRIRHSTNGYQQQNVEL